MMMSREISFQVLKKMVQSFEFVLEAIPVTVSSLPLIGNTVAKKF